MIHIFFLFLIFLSGATFAEQDNLDVVQKLIKMEQYEAAYELLDKEIDKQNPDAFYTYALIELNGYGRPPSLEKAMAFYKQAAMLGHAQSQYELSVLYADEQHKFYDLETSLQWLKEAARNQHGNAQYNLGVYTTNAKHYDLGLKFFKNAFNNGFDKAAISIADYYFHGLGVDIDYNLALEFYEIAAKKGEPRALFTIGMLYERGLGRKKNVILAEEHYTASYATGYKRAGYNLALLIKDQGKVKESRDIMQRLSERGFKMATDYLAGLESTESP